jgi:hypothetical protein
MAVLTVDQLLAGAGTTHTVVLPAHLAGDADDDDAPRTVVVRPLVLADVHRLRRAADGDDELAAALMLQQAIVEPELSYAQVQQLPAGLAEFLLGEVNRVSGLSLGADQVEQLVHAPVARAVFTLSREFGWTPEQCAELTVGQVLLYLEMLGRGERP